MDECHSHRHFDFHLCLWPGCMSATSRLLFSGSIRCFPAPAGWPEFLPRSGATQCDPADLPALFARHRFFPRLDMITQVSAVAGYMGYAGIVLAVLMTWCRAYGWFSTWRCPAGAGDLGFLLGAWGRAGSDRAAQRD